MSNPHLHAATTLVAQDLEVSRQLQSLLEQEREALTQRELQTLSKLTEQKSQALQAIDNNAKQRNQLLQSAGLEASNESWQQFINSLGNHELQENWNALKENLSECQRLNEINGKMIARGRQSMGRLLEILRGQTGTPALYTEAGSTQGQLHSHTLVKA